MKMYRLELTMDLPFGYFRGRTYAGLVIADNEKEARQMMAEYDEDFLNPEKSSCEEVPFEKGVLMTEYAYD